MVELSMTIASRTLKILPSQLLVSSGDGIKYEPNYNQSFLKAPLVFAYRKTTGTDKRVRALTAGQDIMGYPSINMYCLLTDPKKTIVPVTSGSDIDARVNWDRSSSLHDWWVKEFEAGNTTFNEGQTYTLNRYSFDILSTAELDALSKSTLRLNLDGLSTDEKGFKY